MSSATSAWTDERIEQLRTLWEQGMTAGQIATELGEVSRNAVIGKAHRLGLKARPSPVKASEPKETGKHKPVAADNAAPPATPRTKAKSESPRRAAAVDAPVADALIADAPAGTNSADMADDMADDMATETAAAPAPVRDMPRVVSIGPGGFQRQGPGDQQAPIPPAPPRRLVPAKPAPGISDKTSLLDLSEKICRWPMGHPGEPDFHFCGDAVNPGFPYCVQHCGRAYQAQLPRGVRRAPPPLPFGGPRVR